MAYHQREMACPHEQRLENAQMPQETPRKQVLPRMFTLRKKKTSNKETT
jgi:hypothetical protein